MELIDTHCHLDEPAFDGDREAVLSRAAAGGVRVLLTIGTTAASSTAAVALAVRYPTVYAAVGIQPNYVAEEQAGDWEKIQALALESRVVAIGETGLDRHWDYTPFDLQIDAFSRHLALSHSLGKPFIVHCREAEADVVAQLQHAHRPLSGVMHSFAGDAATAQSCLELGLYISFAGMVTFKRNDNLQAIAAGVPLDRLLVETDAPYLAPMPHRGKRNEPAFVAETARVLAELHGVTPDELAAITAANARRLFKLPEA